MIRHKVKVLETKQTMDKAGRPFLWIKTQNLETGKPWTYTTHDPAIWNEFTDNRALDLGVEKRGDFWDIIPKEVKGLTVESIQKSAIEATEKGEPAPQAVGMCTKLVADLYLAGKLSELFGIEAGGELMEWLRGQILGITRILIDGKKLPPLTRKKE